MIGSEHARSLLVGNYKCIMYSASSSLSIVNFNKSYCILPTAYFSALMFYPTFIVNCSLSIINFGKSSCLLQSAYCLLFQHSGSTLHSLSIVHCQLSPAGNGGNTSMISNGLGAKHNTKIRRANHPNAIRAGLNRSSISEGGCCMPINLPIKKENSSQPE